MKILTVLGARPQFIKAAAVSRAIRSRGDITEKIVHTGQHFDRKMSQVFFDEMDIPVPDYELNIHSLSHGAMTGRMIEGIEAIILQENPDVVLVYGDTNSTLAGAVAATKLQVKLAHVEAGLRSFNMAMPEEVNRILTDRISNFLFCPTATAERNLQKEGFDTFPCVITNPGDVMYDSLLYYAARSHYQPARNDYALLTLHRQENTDNPQRLRAIVKALNILAEKFAIVFPIHPRTQKKLTELDIKLSFNPIEPVGYLEMIGLLKGASLVLTDSGGLQKEAYMLNKYCVTLRDETEWTELVEGGYNMLAGADPHKIVELAGSYFAKEIVNSDLLYGDGHASDKICDTLITHIG